MGRRANNLLRQTRLRITSPCGSGQPMSRADLAEAANRWLYEQTGKTFTMDANQVGKYERGENRWPNLHYRRALCAVLGATRPAELGFYPNRTAPTGEADPIQSSCPAPTGRTAATVEQPTQAPASPVPQSETMRRRTLLGLSASALFTTAISVDTAESGGPDLVTVLTSHHEPSDTEPVSPRLLATAVAAAKRQYQSCQYQQAADLLPRLLDQVRTACRWLDGADQLRAYALAADAYQVAGSVLIKHGDIGLAILAAARSTDRDTALDLLDEADALATRLGHDANERWTAFGPTNVLLHRVSAAVSLGDAGQAVAHTQRVPLHKIMLAERRACLFVDVAKALSQWGRTERALLALLAAEDTAPEEVRARPAVRSLVNDLIRSAPSSLYSDIRDLADRIGADR